MSRKLTLIPVGGLCNRMRVIDSAFSLFKDKDILVDIIWFKDWGMGCDFRLLFDPITKFQNIKIRDAGSSDYLLFDRPRKKNFYLPLPFQMLYYDKRIYEKEVIRLLKEGYSFFESDRSERIYCASYHRLHSGSNKYELFRPVKELKAKINELSSSFNADTIGIHVRRTDNEQSVNFSPIELFEQRIKSEINQNDQTNFYLASDSEEVKEHLRDLFGSKLLTYPVKLTRGSEEGIKDALIELYILSRTNKIIGSSASSYSTCAAEISGIPLEIVGNIHIDNLYV